MVAQRGISHVDEIGLKDGISLACIVSVSIFFFLSNTILNI